MQEIEKIGLGSVQFGNHYGISNTVGKTSRNEVHEIIKFCREIKLTIIDTASAYGSSEKILGENNLNSFNIVSKFMPSSEVTSIETQLKETLNHLNLSRIYGYLSHRPNSLIKNQKDWHELLSLKEKGLIEKVGFSVNEVYELEKLLELKLCPEIIQVPFNYFDNRFKTLIIQLKSQGCEIHTRSTFLQGLFFMNTLTLNSYFEEVKEEITLLQNTYGSNLSKHLLKYVIDKDFIDCVIIGVENLFQLKTNLDIFNIEPTLIDRLSTISSEILIPSKWPV
jgi:aryl-alcohol dehydrogenase-like predicted oxidoreductase